MSSCVGADHPMLNGGSMVTTILESIYARGSVTARQHAVLDPLRLPNQGMHESWSSKARAVATSPAVGIDLTLSVWRRLTRIRVAAWTRFHRRGRHCQEPNREAWWHDALCSPSIERFVVSVNGFAIRSPRGVRNSGGASMSLCVGADHPMLNGGSMVTTILESIFARGSVTARQHAVLDPLRDPNGEAFWRQVASSVKQKHNRGTDCTCARRDS